MASSCLNVATALYFIIIIIILFESGNMTHTQTHTDIQTDRQTEYVKKSTIKHTKSICVFFSALGVLNDYALYKSLTPEREF